MDFINKLIKKGAFGLLLVFSFFVFSNGMKVEAAECSITLNDDNKYLVVNAGLNWKDSGVTAKCDSVVDTNVSVQINNGTAIATTDSGLGVANTYVSNPGFYRIKYYLTNTPVTYVERQIRVLPNNLNNVKNFWLGNGEIVSTENDDAFNKIIDTGTGYLAVGDFSNVGYVVAFNYRGEYLWDEQFGGTTEVVSLQISDVIKADEGNKLYYISGQYTNSSSKIIGYARRIEVNSDNTGINNTGEGFIEFVDMNSVSSLTIAGNYLFAAGYKNNADATKTGVIARFLIGSANSIVSYINNLNSQYNSIISIDGGANVVAVGSTSVDGYAGATGGLITTCSASVSSEINCANQEAYYYLNKSGATSTITRFNDIVSYETLNNETNYLVVGESRIDSVDGVLTSNNAGLEDALIVVLNNAFEILDVKLSGTSSSDSLKSIKEIDAAKFVAVGKWSSVGYYNEIDVTSNNIQMVEKILSGTSVVLNDVLVKKSSDEENQYVFVGCAQSSTVEDVIVVNKGGKDALIALLDNTSFSNYADIDIKQGTQICESSTSCGVEGVYETYWLMYGTRKIKFTKGIVISTDNVTQAPYETYHEFSNGQNIKIMIGRKISVSANPKAPDITSSEIGIDKWYLYSRPQNISSDINNNTRKQTWNEYYYPVDNHLEKVEGETYYKFSLGNFSVDTSEGETSLNYIKLASEPQSLNVAFQTVEKAKEFALLQEFTRIALVKENYYDSNSNSVYFTGEGISLRRQNYYFVYYIDLQITNEYGCGTKNGVLYGNCTNFNGYAFASLSSIKTVANNIVELYDYFVSENNNRFNPNSNIALPQTEEFRQELTTIKYLQNTTVDLTPGLSLEVKYYALNGNTTTGYSDFDAEDNYTSLNSIDYASNKTKVEFSAAGDFRNEGKYTIRYCYTIGDKNCGEAASFVIDRTAPVINYNLISGGVGQINISYGTSNLLMLKTSSKITSITDADPYAYTILDGTKYYLKCNETSEKCISEVNEFVERSFEYEKENPDKIFDIHVYDRAGNKIDVYFKVGTANPTVLVNSGSDLSAFEIKIDFFEKNKILDNGFHIYFTSNDSDCTSGNCTMVDAEWGRIIQGGSFLDNQIMFAIEALMYNNKKELEKQIEDPTYEPQLIANLNLSFGALNAENLRVVKVPLYVYNETTDRYETTTNIEFITSSGLYNFIIQDEFNNFSEDYGGIGIGKAELHVYIEADEEYVESCDGNHTQLDAFDNVIHNGLVDADGTFNDSYKKLPKLENEITADSTGVFKAVTPNTYSYLEQLPTALLSEFNEKMLFTNQFIYVKFAVTDLGIVKISRANSLNTVGNYINGQKENISCMLTLYGEAVTEALDSTCKITQKDLYGYENPGLADISTNYEFGDIVSTDAANVTAAELKAVLAYYGIYYIGEDSEDNGDGSSTLYYYMAFIKDGTYKVESRISPVIGGLDTGTVSLPTEYAFTIDSIDPVIDFAVVCGDGEGKCTGDKLAYTNKSDFVYTDSENIKTNIGNYDMKLVLDSDEFNFIDALGNSAKEKNRLLVVSMDGGKTYYNAYDYALENSDVNDGNYILFTESGKYEIRFYDAGGNEIVYRFMIDKTAPEVVQIRDINGKNFEEYQQYVEVSIVVEEDSFLNNTGNMLTIDVWTAADANKITIGVVNNGGVCEIGAGSGFVTNDNPCSVDENGITVTFTLEINKNEKLSDVQTLTMNVTDYFGNTSKKSQSFIFDNLAPYIYFADSYTPSTDFGPNVDNEGRELWLSTPANSSLGNFVCDGVTETLVSGVIICKDTPENEGKKNNIVIEAYEAQRVAYNNFVQNQSGTYSPIANGTYLDVQNVVYKQKFQPFNAVQATALFDEGGTVYTKGKYVQITENELVNPNTTYSYLVSGTMQDVSIKDMYTNSSAYTAYTSLGSCDPNNKLCVLYRMYVEHGYFTDNTFYVYDTNSYTEVEDVGDIVAGETYYYTNSYVKDEGRYLPAVTLNNSCVVVAGANDGKCIGVVANRIKLDDETHTYYNLISKTAVEESAYVVNVELVGGTAKYAAIKDERIWQIAINTRNEEVKFGFGIASNTGRPIIFRAKDGAGNISNTYLETVITIEDRTPPTIANVSSISYVLEDESEVVLSKHYLKVSSYYKLVKGTACKEGATYYKSDDGISYTDVKCDESWDEDIQYYVEVVEYKQVSSEDVGKDKEDNKSYYVLDHVTDLGDNYLTKEDMVVTFNEPIYKIECSYYVFDSGNNSSFEKECSFNNTEFDYREEKKSFELIYEEDPTKEYYVNYHLVAYDFSGNKISVNWLFIDREKPVIMLDSDVNKIDYVEVEYASNEIDTKYNSEYLNTLFINEIHDIDKLNNRIKDIEVGSKIDNTISYEVAYKKFNYNKVYKNYIIKDHKFELVPVDKNEDGIIDDKDPNVTYYILILNTGEYVLKGNSGIDSNGETCDVGDYCYIIDDRTYYPELLGDDRYWTAVDGTITKDKVGVYRVEYRAIDKSGNISETTYKTIYIEDNTAPALKIDDKEATSKYGWHHSVYISIENEKEAYLDRYTCALGTKTCTLPTQIFADGNSELVKSSQVINDTHGFTDSAVGMSKLYFYDSGKYITTTTSDGSNIKTLVYNYVEYQYIIDQDPPIFTLTAKEENSKMYFELILEGNEDLYCLKEDRMAINLSFNNSNKELCQNILKWDSAVVNETGTGTIVDSRYNGNNLVYERTYTKVAPGSQKYFYNTYYYRSDNNFEAIPMGVEHDASRDVYLLTSIKMYFREDGAYLLLAQDKAGNSAGRSINGTIYQKRDDGTYPPTEFVIDNTAPTFNANGNLPTGINYWYSVPSQIINNGNLSLVRNLGNKNGKYYNISDSGLNSPFFYAFASKNDAKEYIRSLYANHITAQPDNSCQSGVGFKYSYYDSDTGTMKEQCFIDTSGANQHRVKALNYIEENVLNNLVFSTFSGNALFGSASIVQSTYDESNMYETIYLKRTDNGSYVSQSIVESCVASANVECIKVNVKIVKNTGSNTTSYMLGGIDNLIDPDSFSMTIYNSPKGGSTESDTKEVSNHSFTLNNNTYYIFEERDTQITYRNSLGTDGLFCHDNVTYYAIYVDTNDYIDIYYKDDKGESTSGLINTEGRGDVKTNHDIYNLIIKDKNDSDFLNKYEIYERFMVDSDGYQYVLTKDGQYVYVGVERYSFINDEYVVRSDGKYALTKDGTAYVEIHAYVLEEVYSYLILSIRESYSDNGTNYSNTAYHNLNDYIVGVCFDGENNVDCQIDSGKAIGYYFEIPIVNVFVDGDIERTFDIHVYDRAGTDTYLTMSHSQVDPRISVSYSGEAGDQTVQLELSDTMVTDIVRDSVKVYFSKDRTNYSEAQTVNIRKSLLCERGTTGYVYGCINEGIINGSTIYKVRISDLENLYGFFKVVVADNHGNTNDLEFMYNPADLTAIYNSDVSFINDEGEIKRTITNQDLKIEWNNELNYIILYKKNESGEFETVCNSKNMINSSNHLCDGTNGNSNNYVEIVVENEKYSKSILHFVEEGLYKAEIINRASITINQVYLNSEKEGFVDDLKSVVTPVFDANYLTCPWESDNDYCASPYEIITNDVVKQQATGTSFVDYTLFEIDKTAPIINNDSFNVVLASSSEKFKEGAAYQNAEVKLAWTEKYVHAEYLCEYLIEGNSICGDSQGRLTIAPTQTVTNKDGEVSYYYAHFYAKNAASVSYAVKLKDIAGNSTNEFTFTINIVLPKIEVYEIDEANNIIEGAKVENKETYKIKNNAKLICYDPITNETLNCNNYDVKLQYKVTENSWKEITNMSDYKATHSTEITYKFIASIKFTLGTESAYYNKNEGTSILKSEVVFTIDKVAPEITISGKNDNPYGIYHGQVTVNVASDGRGTIYGGCVVVEEDNNGNKIYECSETPIATDVSNYTIFETGTYKVSAVDEIGNVTKGKEIKYFTIDNDAPSISVTAKSTYLNYKLSEKGYTNASAVLVEAVDNNIDSKFMYCLVAEEGLCEWVTSSGASLEFAEEGYYKVKPIDIVGNVGIERSFIIYRQKPTFEIYYSQKNTLGEKNKVYTEDVFVTWKEPTSVNQAPIVKATLNGYPYEKQQSITETGEYVLVLVDLAGNTTTHKISINKSDKICLDNVCITPHAQFIFNNVGEKAIFEGNNGYTFKKDDVLIYATPTNYYGGNEDCAYNIFNYRSLLDKEAYNVLTANQATRINNSSVEEPYVFGTFTPNTKAAIDEVGGTVYIFVVSLDVAKDDLDFDIGENFFTKDPLGWSLIFIAGAGFIYMGVKLVFFKKKVKVLK